MTRPFPRADARTRTGDPFITSEALRTPTSAAWRTDWRAATKSPANGQFHNGLAYLHKLLAEAASSSRGGRVIAPPPLRAGRFITRPPHPPLQVDRLGDFPEHNPDDEHGLAGDKMLLIDGRSFGMPLGQELVFAPTAIRKNSPRLTGGASPGRAPSAARVPPGDADSNRYRHATPAAGVWLAASVLRQHVFEPSRVGARTVRVRACLHRRLLRSDCCKLRTVSLQAISARRR
jgi:hypothetical protein